MTAPGAAGQKSATVRLSLIGLLAVGVAVALYAAGRLHTPNYGFSLFGRVGLDAIVLKSVLASVALGLAAVQVLLALWIYRKLPLAGSAPRAAPGAQSDRRRAVRHHRADRRALPHRLWRAAHQPPGCRAFAGGLFLLRCPCREGLARTEQAAARLGTAGSGRRARRLRRDALVHLGAVVLQRPPAARRLAVAWAGVTPRAGVPGGTHAAAAARLRSRGA